MLSSTTNREAQTPTYVEVLPSFAHCRWMNTNTARQEYASPARIRYSNKVLYTMFRTPRRLCTDVLSFVGCQTSTNFKFASLGMRGAQERALLVPDDNVGTYGSCTIIKMKTTVVVVLNKYRLLVYNSIFLLTVCCIQKYSTQKVQTAVHPPSCNVPVYGM